MQILCGARARTEIVDIKSGRVVKRSGWQRNLLLDQGLDGLAGNSILINPCQPSTVANTIAVGSGTTPTAVASGAITFTQDNGGGLSGNILTASGGFFNSGMVGQLFKWGTGTGGVETYITGYTSTTQVTVDTSALITVGVVGTVWAVNQVVLFTPLYTSTSYQTNPGDCGTTYGGATFTMQRKLIIAPQSVTYNVNEIGYGPNLANASSRVAGRIVLSGTDVVTPTQYYLVTLQFQTTVSPGIPTAVPNIGTAINTAGKAMIEGVGLTSFSPIASDGSTTGHGALENGSGPRLCFATTNYTQNGTPSAGSNSGVLPATTIILPGANWLYGSARGLMKTSFTGSTTTSGQTMYGAGLVPSTGSTYYCMDILFTTPQTAPTGLFVPQFVFSATWNRQLSN